MPDSARCVQCGICSYNCPIGIDVRAHAWRGDPVVHSQCRLAFVESVGHASLGLLLDTYHVNIAEASWEAPIRCLMQAGRLWHVHLGDNNGLAPGDGMIDFGALVRALRAAGYDGALSAELLARPDPDTAARRTVEHMRPLLEDA